MPTPTNLPQSTIEDSAAATRLFFDTYGKLPLEFAANEVEACIAFFEGKGFDKSASIIIAAAILKQAKLDEIPIFKILDTLKGFETVELSTLVAEILNNNRPPTSILGFRLKSVSKESQTRNIAA